MPRYRKRARDEDDATPEHVFTDFVNVENRRGEPFPEEFGEGPYGAPPREGYGGGAAGPPAGSAPGGKDPAQGREDNAPGPLN